MLPLGAPGSALSYYTQVHPGFELYEESARCTIEKDKSYIGRWIDYTHAVARLPQTVNYGGLEMITPTPWHRCHRSVLLSTRP